MKYIDFSGTSRQCDSAVLDSIEKQTSVYAAGHGLKNMKIETIENNAWSDPKNERYDIEISFARNPFRRWQKLLFLKGELIDGENFHRRFSEFY